MKKIIMLGISLVIMLAFLVACNQGDKSVTLENMKKILMNTGYAIIENYTELYEPHEDSIHTISGFSFVFLGEHGNVSIPVLEFKDNASAESYAEIVNSSDDFLAIVNDRFLTISEAHNGVAHESERLFLENLINGKSIK